MMKEQSHDGQPFSQDDSPEIRVHGRSKSNGKTAAKYGWLATMAIAPAAMAAPLTGLPADFFPIGVFYQPAAAQATTSFAGWKGRGVNTLIGYETQGGKVAIDDYTSAAIAAGLNLIREPRSDPSLDVEPQIIGWLHNHADEPEDDPSIDPASLQANYANLKAINPNRPVMINFAGAHMVDGYAGLRWASPKSAAVYAPYIQAADWVAQDVYPVTGWLQPKAIGVVGAATATLAGWSGKPTFAYIETSNQRLFTSPEIMERGPTPAETRAEIWDAIIHGAKGIAYFPQAIYGFRYDATPVDVATEMTRQDEIITRLAKVLNSDETPNLTSVQFDQPSIEYMLKSLDGVTYLIALNLSDQLVNTTFTGDFPTGLSSLTVLNDLSTISGDSGTFSDTFGAYGVRVYAESSTGAQPLVIPEPGVLGLLAAAPLLMGRGRRSRKLPRSL
jgi:hypothetical protein